MFHLFQRSIHFNVIYLSRLLMRLQIVEAFYRQNSRRVLCVLSSLFTMDPFSFNYSSAVFDRLA